MERTRYDPCEYGVDVRQSMSPLAYQLNPIRYENCHKCRNEGGLVGGQDVSLSTRNLVDLESNLSGRSFGPSRQACGLFLPGPRNGKRCTHRSSDSGIPYDCPECQEDKLHLRPCRMAQHKPKPVDVGYSIKQLTCDDLNTKRLRSSIPMKQQDLTAASSVKPYQPKNWQSNTGLAAF